jgi:hypothetical protein
MKKLNLLRAMFVMMAMFPAASSVFAQGDRNPIQKPSATAKSAVVAVMREDKLQFVTEKSRLMGYVQKALAKTNRGEVVKNIDIRTFEKGSFLQSKLKRAARYF